MSDDLGRCPGCHQLVRLVASPKGKTMYLDPDPVPDGRWVIEGNAARAFRPMFGAADTPRYQAHYATCPRPRSSDRKAVREAADRAIAKAREGL